MVAAVSYCGFLLHLLLWLLGNVLIKKGLDIEYSAGAEWLENLGAAFSELALP